MLRWRLLGLILLALPAWAGNWNVRTQPRQGVVVWVQAPAVERPSGAGKHAGAQAGAHWGATAEHEPHLPMLRPCVERQSTDASQV